MNLFKGITAYGKRGREGEEGEREGIFVFVYDTCQWPQWFDWKVALLHSKLTADPGMWL